jgi:hypothetical protein
MDSIDWMTVAEVVHTTAASALLGVTGDGAIAFHLCSCSPWCDSRICAV